MSVLDEAKLIVEERGESYGHPRENFTGCAAMWTAYLTRRGLLTGPLDPTDIAMMNILQKVDRHAFKRKPDNLLDVCGYAWCAEKCDESVGK